MGISDGYRSEGVGKFYENHSQEYANPHALYVEQCLNFCSFQSGESILDLGCGDGLITKILKQRGPYYLIGLDKYMAQRYRDETGFICYEASFEEVAMKGLPTDEHFDTVICSYMVDIIPESYRHNFFWNVAAQTNRLMVIRPNSHILDFPFLELEYRKKVGKAKMTIYRSKLCETK
jgi:2-polyprenyl-3-methyl-5-hydroxy-6-metoxy-1,4-benzoquinol methylase